MSRPRKVSKIISDYKNIQHTAHDLKLTAKAQSAIQSLRRRFADNGKCPVKAENAIRHAINSARMQSNMAKISQAEYKAIYLEQAKRAADMLEFVETQFDGERISGGDRFYLDLINEGIDEKTVEAYQADLLFKNRSLLRELLTLIDQRSTAIAERIEPAAYRHNEPHHILAQHLMAAAKSGVLPVAPSASKTSRMADLFSEAAQIAGLDPGDPAKYLKDK